MLLNVACLAVLIPLVVHVLVGRDTALPDVVFVRQSFLKKWDNIK